MLSPVRVFTHRIRRASKNCPDPRTALNQNLMLSLLGGTEDLVEDSCGDDSQRLLG